MSATLQSQAVSIANNMIAIGASLYSVEQQINQISSQFTQLTLGTVFAAMATTPVNADGSLGTADGSPNTEHVIDTRVVTGLGRAISSTDLATLNTLLTAVATLLSGAATTQQGEAPQLLAKLVGG